MQTIVKYNLPPYSLCDLFPSCHSQVTSLATPPPTAFPLEDANMSQILLLPNYYSYVILK